jgi:hypothetical protein
MQPEAAQAKLDAYQQQLKRHSDEEYTAAVKGYKALAKGTPLINLPEVIRAGGLFDNHRPRLSVGRSDRRHLRVSKTWGNWQQPAGFTFSTSRPGYRIGHDTIIQIAWPEVEKLKINEGYALVPMVPADVRPNVDLAKCVTLWEVQAWSVSRLDARPDRDPYLLQNIAGDLYAVIAEWELTDLERAIMADRIPA